MAEVFLQPNSSVRLVDNDQKVTRDWLPYLAGIEALSKAAANAGGLTDLGGGATLAQVIAQVNALTAALRGEE